MLEPIAPKDRKKMHRGTLYIDDEYYGKLLMIQKRTGRSMNDIIRQIVKNYLDKVEK